MNIRVGDFEVFENGSIIGNENAPIDFIFNEKIGFIIRVQFQSDLSIEGPKVTAAKFGKVGGIFTFSNFESTTGVGIVTPLKVGTYSNRELYLIYRIYALEKGGKNFQFTWLLGKEVKNVK